MRKSVSENFMNKDKEGLIFDHKDDIVDAIVKVVESQYKEDIDLVIVYGSYVTGVANPFSDIDFCFVPNTETAYDLMHTFIMHDIGYDLWPMHWARLEGFSDFKESMVSILLDCQVVFARNQTCIDRFRKLQEHARMQMNKDDNGHLLWRIGFLFNDMKGKLYDLKTSKLIGQKRLHALSFLEDCLTVIAYLNKTYVRKGPERIHLEKENFTYMPEGYLDILNKVSHHKWEDTYCDFLVEVFNRLQDKYVDEKTSNKGDLKEELVGFYEEFKSAYNKVIHALESGNQLKLAYAAKQIDGETDNLFGQEQDFPRLLDTIEDPATTLEMTIKHEKILLNHLETHEVAIQYVSSREELEALLSKQHIEQA